MIPVNEAGIVCFVSKGLNRPPEIVGTWARVPRHKSDLAGTFELFFTYLPHRGK